MTTSNSTTTQVGPGFLGILALIFITLKLIGYISWPWLWVLSPLWIPLAIVLAIFALIAIAYMLYIVVALINETTSQRKWKKTQAAHRALMARSNAMNK